MACEIYKTYTTAVPTLARTTSHRIVAWVYSEQWFDQWANQLVVNGMSCEEASEYIQENWQAFDVFDEDLGTIVSIPRLIAKAGSTITCCADVNENASTGGQFQILDFDLTNPVLVGGVSYPGACTPVDYPVDGSWGLFMFQSFVGGFTTWTPTIEVVDTVQLSNWLCCTAGCCGGLIPSGPPKFLIPRPASPQPGEENVNTPPLQSLVKVSNHTYQFTNNFGRVKK